MRNVSLESCIRWAYNVPQRQISGPGWLNLERFDIVAKSSSPASEMQLRLMLQTLLADRFKLALHRESKEMSVFVLLVGKGGHKLSESQGDGPPKMQPNKMLMVCERVTMPQLCELLSDPMQAPVLDLTELKGRYDFSLDPSKYLPADLSPGDGGKSPGDGAKMRLAEELPTMFRSMLQDQLGLRMESRKAPVEILIIDAAEKAPTEN
jgi:uncharacterized protein (TIGR03435 family)